MTIFLALLAVMMTAFAPHMAQETRSAWPLWMPVVGWIAVGGRVWLDSIQGRMR